MTSNGQASGIDVPAGARACRGRRGQSLLEACLAIFLICLIFAGLFQVSQLFAAREVLYHAANRGTRARAVGFNNWMVFKAARVAAIPNSGRMLVPDFVNDNPALQGAVQTMRPGELWAHVLGTVPAAQQTAIEKARIPHYLGAQNAWQAQHILDYQDWDGLHVSMPPPIDDSPNPVDPILHATVSQQYRLWVPMHSGFYDADFVDLAGESYVETHFPLYLALP